MPLSPDIVAILLTGAAVGGAGFLLLLRASIATRDPWFLLWVAACVFQSLVTLLNGLRPLIPFTLAVGGTNALQLLALGLLWAGICRLRDCPVPAWTVLGAPAIWGCACLVPGFLESDVARLGLLWPLVFVLLAGTALNAWMIYRDQTIRAALDLSVLFGALALGTLLRIYELSLGAPSELGHGSALAQAILASAMPFLALSMEHERRRLADAARSAAAGRLSSLGEMAAGLAHEVNTPLAIIGLAAENAADALEDNDPEARRYVIERLRLIAETVQRGRSVIDHVETFARDADALPETQPSSLALVLEGAASLTQGLLRPHGIALDMQLPPELLKVAGPVVPLEQVFSNLILNAKDAICASGRSGGVIRIRANPRGDCVEVDVEDNGGGIPDAVLPRIFEPFFSTKMPGQGTGLGLSIVRGTLRKLGGTVRASNGRDGACFKLRLPHAA